MLSRRNARSCRVRVNLFADEVSSPEKGKPVFFASANGKDAFRNEVHLVFVLLLDACLLKSGLMKAHAPLPVSVVVNAYRHEVKLALEDFVLKPDGVHQIK